MGLDSCLCFIEKGTIVESFGDLDNIASFHNFWPLELWVEEHVAFKKNQTGSIIKLTINDLDKLKLDLKGEHFTADEDYEAYQNDMLQDAIFEAKNYIVEENKDIYYWSSY